MQEDGSPLRLSNDESGAGPSRNEDHLEQSTAEEVDLTISSVDTSANVSSTSFQQLSPEKLLKMIQKHAPRGMKYCLTMVPKDEEISLEKIMKEKRQKRIKKKDVKFLCMGP